MNSKNMNIAALAAGAVGLIACFMPLVEGFSMFDAAKAGVTEAYIPVVAFLGMVVCAGLALKNGDFSKQLAMGVTVLSVLALIKVRDGLDLPGMTGKLLLVAAVVGLVAGGIGVKKAGGGDAPASGGDGGGEG